MRYPWRSVASGACFAAAWSIFIDSAIIASAADSPATFIGWVPGILGTLAFVLVNFTKAADFTTREAHETQTHAVTLAVGWALAFASSCMALLLLVIRYGADHHRERSALGIAIVLQTCGLALGSALSWAREGPGPADSSGVARL